MQTHLQRVEIETAWCGDDDLAIDHAVVGKMQQQRLVQLGKIAIERTQISALNVDVTAPAEHDGAKAVPLRLVEKRAAGRQRLSQLRQHRLDGWLDRKGHV